MQDKILKIAESLGLERFSSLGGHFWIGDSIEYQRIFNPYGSDADAFKVLEASLNKLEEVRIFKNHAYNWFDVDMNKCPVGRQECLRESICEAYLSLIQQEEGE